MNFNELINIMNLINGKQSIGANNNLANNSYIDILNKIKMPSKPISNNSNIQDIVYKMSKT